LLYLKSIPWYLDKREMVHRRRLPNHAEDIDEQYERGYIMKQLRLAIGVTTLYVAIATGPGQAHADIVDILIDNANITVLQPAQGEQPVPFFFAVTVHNNSPYVLDFEYAFDDMFNQIGGISVAALYQGPGPYQGPLAFTDLTGVMTPMPAALPLRACGDGISLMCLRPNETFVGNIAYGLVDANTPTGLYAVTQDGEGFPATMTFQGTYMLPTGEKVSFTQGSPSYSVNVVPQNAVPEAHPWVLLMAGLASVLLISSRRIRG
jgi:hypothetical protein